MPAIPIGMNNEYLLDTACWRTPDIDYPM